MNPAEVRSLLSYQLDEIYPIEQHFRVLDPDSIEDEGDQPRWRYQWNWYVAGERKVAVVVGAWMAGTKEQPQEVRVTAIALFNIESGTAGVPLQLFVQRDAPSILVAYVRENVRSLLARSRHRFIISDLEIGDIAQRFPYVEASGTKFLLEHPGAAANFGIPFEPPDLKPKRVKGRKKKKEE